MIRILANYLLIFPFELGYIFLGFTIWFNDAKILIFVGHYLNVNLLIDNFLLRINFVPNAYYLY